MIAVRETDPFQIDAGTPAASPLQQTTALADGRFVVAWKDSDGLLGDANGTAIKAKIVNADGSVSVPEFLVNTSTTGDQVHARVDALAGGGFVVTWLSSGVGAGRGQIYDATGTKVGGEIIANATGDVAALTDGDFVMSTSGGLQRYHADGQLVGAATPWTVPAGGANAQLVALQNGAFGSTYTTASGLFLQKYDTAGQPDGTVQLAGPSSAYVSAFRSVSFAALDDGGYAVAFIESYDGDRNMGHVEIVRANRIAAGTHEITYITGDGYNRFEAPPSSTSLATNGTDVIVGWTDQDGVHLPDVDFQGGGAPPTSTWGLLDIAMSADGHFLVSWGEASGAVGAQIFEELPSQNGTTGADVLTGTAGSDLMHGLGGNDVLIGAGGIDYLYGDDGDDVIVVGPGASWLYGGAGHDAYYIADSATHVVEGQDQGYDSIYSGADLTLPDNVEALFLTSGAVNGAGNALDNVLGGNALDNSLQGLDGNDNLYGGDGQDSLYGGTGDDTLHGQSGDDLLYGWTGADHIEGGTGADTIYGEDGADTLYGEDGNDTLYAGTGDDFLAGQVGTDALWGEAGNDFLYGGENADQLAGQAGADVFYYKAMTEGGDTILDFNSAEGDRIIVDAAAFGAFSGFQLTASLGFISGAGAAPTAATATFYYDTATQNLWYDVDGTGASQGVLIAHMANNPTLHAYDFIFA